MLWKYVRTVGRFICFCSAVMVAVLDYFFTIRLRGLSDHNLPRAQWLMRNSRRVLRSINVDVVFQGTPPSAGLITANHLGYLDILVLGAIRPSIFLSKSEVRNWPLVGSLTACAGTLFIRRDKKSDVARFDEAFARVVDSGALLAIFPEGTSTDGHRVLPFRSSLFAAAAANHWPATPVWLGYEVEQGCVETDVCYWGDATFFSHFPKLIALKKIKATVVFGTAVPAGLDRKEMVRQLHQQVCQIGEKFRPGLITSNPARPAVV